ncbi:MAG: helix-turn-helix domain-containing protein [Oscillospiraceae bacterium]|nr:helix-turn-helix domain-containing protein [Oscillospiraceae bacterium]
MRTGLTLKEKLRDLREEKDLKLSDVSDATGIPKSTLQRLEYDSDDLNAPETRVGYQDITTLAKFYDVSADYLLGLTENLQYRNDAIDKLRLSDEAVSELISGKLNTRLLSELIVHPDFADLLSALEVFVDRTLSENMEITNKVYKIAVDKISKKSITVGRDEYIATLKEASIDPDDYLRFRLTQRFEKIAQSLYNEHAKETKSEAGAGFLKMFNKQLSKYEETKDETGNTEQAKLALLAEQLGIDLKKAPEEEKRSLLNLFKRSKFAQFFKKRK